MDPFNDLLNGQRRLSPPPDAVVQLERHVMARLEQLPRLRRRKRILAGSAALVCVVMAVVALVVNRPRVTTMAPPDFTESVVIMDKLICIWLEPADSPSQRGRAHE